MGAGLLSGLDCQLNHRVIEDVEKLVRRTRLFGFRKMLPVRYKNASISPISREFWGNTCAHRRGGRDARGQKRRSERKFLPGYVLVEMELNDDTWHLVRKLPRVMGFIGGKADQPAPLSPRGRSDSR